MKQPRLLPRLAISVLCVGLASFVMVGQTPQRDSGSPVASDSKAGATAVTIDNFSFSPATLTVPAGTTVVWTNHDDIPHTVVEDNKRFKSKALDTDDTFSYTFAESGTYEYFCSLHPKMTAKIIVEPKT